MTIPEIVEKYTIRANPNKNLCVKREILKHEGDKAYISFSELKDGETFTFRYGDREHRFTDHIYMCVDENYVGERIVIDLTVFDCFYIGDYEEIDVRRIKYKVVAEDDEKRDS